MDFFDRQERARKQSRRLVLLFGLAVVLAVFLTCLVAVPLAQIFGGVLAPADRKMTVVGSAFYTFFKVLAHPEMIMHWGGHPWLVAGVVVSVLASITLGCLYKMRQLSDGGPAVAELLGGRCVEVNPENTDEQRLRHVVEEMAIASGTPVPEIYVLDNERGINAFAAGYTRDDVAIGVTRGAVKLLTRDELQGIIAHEFSHILNGDTRLNMRLMALAHGLIWPTILGRLIVRKLDEALDPDGDPLDQGRDTLRLLFVFLALPMFLLGLPGLPFTRLLKSAICRQREWLADAEAVQFTRNPAGIGGALKKIGGMPLHGRLRTPYAETASHLYFADWTTDHWFNCLETHPPLEKRVSAIDPYFDGKFPRVKTLLPNQYERDQECEERMATIVSVGERYPETLVAGAGTVTADYIRRVNAVRLGLPAELLQAVRSPADASTVIYCLLLSEDESIKSAQWQILGDGLEPAQLQRVQDLVPKVQELGPKVRVILAEYAVPALRQLGWQEYQAFANVLQQLVESDGAIELFEYMLLKMVSRQLRSYFQGAQTQGGSYGTVKQMAGQCSVVLSALACMGSDDEAKAMEAFKKGRDFLDAPGCHIPFLGRSEWALVEVDEALTRLAQAPPYVQRNVLMACGRTVAADGCVTEREAELLRAVADSLDCPVPPFVEVIRNEQLAAENAVRE